jgi:probable DNA repair protein
LERYLELIDAGATVVTATDRLYRAIVAAHDRRQREGRARVWDRPDVLPFGAFVGRAFDDLLHAGALGDAPEAPLGPAAELVLWEQAVRGDGEAPDLLDVAATAEMARGAWKLQQEWQLPRVDGHAPLGEDQRAYARWAGRFADACRERGVIDASRLPVAVAEAWERGAPLPPGSVVWAGFDERTPLRERLDRALVGGGVQTRELDPGGGDPAADAVVRMELPGADDELRAFAGWARDRLERDPGARLALVLPNVDELRDRAEAALGEVLQPRRALEPAPSRPKLWNVSIGPALADYRMIAAALDLLRFTRPRPGAGLTGSVVRSPYLAGAREERSARAQLDARLRESGEPRFSLDRLSRWAAETPVRGETSIGEPCPRLAGQLRALRELIAEPRHNDRPGGWAERFAARLGAAGWPGDGPLTSEEYQLLDRWRELLDELAGLDAVLAPIGEDEAITRLARAAGRAVFQPRSPEVPIQVLGVLEAAGLSFDGLWIAGLHDDAWPPPARPNPFLPLAWQRECGLREASAGLQGRWARRVTSRLLASAPEAVVSSPQLEGERELMPSPLIQAHPAAAEGGRAVEPAPPLPAWLRAGGALEEIDDERAPPVAGGVVLSGGTALFADQAACPFRGFAHHRLHAQAIERHERGIDARVRGKLVHDTLERLWGGLGDAAELASMPSEALEQALADCARAAVEHERARRPHAWTPGFVELEVGRLVRSVGRWLGRERERPPFVVEGCEESETLSIGGVCVGVRLDRIDRLTSGGRVILDYKTGSGRIPAWFEERMDEPQLPLYAVHADAASVDAVALVHVRPEGPRVRGVARKADLLPGVRAFDATKEAETFGDFDGLLACWREWLGRLADEIRSGHAAVAPKKPPQTCRFCDLRPLCRIDERLGWHPHGGGAEDDEAGAAGGGDE